RAVGGPGRGGAERRMGAELRPGDGRLRRAGRLRQLRGRAERHGGGGRVRAGELRAARGGQDGVRPRQRLPEQHEHPAARLAVVDLTAGRLRAAFAPEVGMIGCSLADGGEELLGQRGGLAAYRERGSTFGIPLLYPWANRLAREVGSDLVRRDPNGLPIHGLLAAYPRWELRDQTTDWLAARLD